MESKIGKNSAPGIALPMETCEPADHISLEISMIAKQAVQSFNQVQQENQEVDP